MPVPNRVRGEIEVSIGGTKFVLSPEFKRLAQFEAIVGCSVVTFFQRFLAMRAGGDCPITLGQTAEVVAVLAKEPSGKNELSVEEIGDLLVADGMIRVLNPIGEMIGRALSGGRKAEKTDGDDAGKPTGDGPSAA